MISNDEMHARLSKLPGERVTDEYMRSRIVNVDYIRLGKYGRLTHCTITLDNGWMTTGEDATIDPQNYDAEIGQKLAYDVAFRKLWEVFGFTRMEALFHGAASRAE